MTTDAVLLDTCAAIWLVRDGPLAAPARQAIVQAGRGDGVFVSAVTAWEIGFLAYPAKGRPRLQFLPDAKTWFANLLAMPVVREATFSGEIAVEAAILPGDFHRDPADRLMVATARILDMPVVTRNDKILAYAAAGHVRAIAC